MYKLTIRIFAAALALVATGAYAFGPDPAPALAPIVARPVAPAVVTQSPVAVPVGAPTVVEVAPTMPAAAPPPKQRAKAVIKHTAPTRRVLNAAPKAQAVAAPAVVVTAGQRAYLRTIIATFGAPAGAEISK